MIWRCKELEGHVALLRDLQSSRAHNHLNLQVTQVLTPYIAKSHIVITTAAVPGRQAPRLMTQAMVDSMGPGTVIVDLAAETGGNVEGSKPGEIVITSGGVKIWGGKDVPSQLPLHPPSALSSSEELCDQEPQQL